MYSQDEKEEFKKEPTMMDSREAEELIETPYDFRAEYKERITSTTQEDEDERNNFSTTRFHAIGIGVLVCLLLAILGSVLFFGGSEDENTVPVTIAGANEGFKERPTSVGGMDIPDQDKLVYKRIRSDDMDTKVERLFPQSETPVIPTPPLVAQEPSLPVEETQSFSKSTAPVFVAQENEEEQLEVISTPKVVVTKPVVKVESAPVIRSAKKVIGEIWRVQLLSMSSRGGVEKAWPPILKAHRALLSGLSQDIVAVTIPGKGTYYRLRVGPFQSKEGAKNLCDKLKARKQECSLVK